MGVRARPYLVAVACVAAAVLSRIALEPVLHETQAWLTFWPAVFLAAWWGGGRAVPLALALSMLAVFTLVIEPNRAFAAGAVVFVVCGAGFGLVAEQARRSRERDRRLMQELDSARAEAQKASRAKDEFLAMLGHELRNPLAPMTTATALLRMRGERSAELDAIERQVAHMTRLVDDLLDVSRIVRGRLELRRAPVEIAAAIDKAVEMVSPLAETAGQPIEVDVPRGVWVDGDVQRLIQVFTNLLTNALKFGVRGVPITVRGERAAGRVVVRVIDRGAGIAPAMLDRVFEPFVQEAQPIDRAQGGLGLGLAIVRRLVDAHGGTVVARSEGTGKGAELVVELPVITAPVEQAPAPVVHGGAAKKPQNILIVDDNQDIAFMIGTLLETMGHTVQVAHDGAEALDAVRRFTPTLGLLDIGLPVMDGYELARQLRAQGIAVPLVAMTGYSQDSDRAKTREAGFARHLVKPVDADTLRTLIDELA